MYFQYGNYKHAVNEASINIGWTPMKDQKGRIYGKRHIWTINGEIQAASQSALSTALLSLEAAYAVNGAGLVGLFFDDGTPTQHVITPNNMLRGVTIENFQYGDSRSAEYSTFRTYSIGLEILEKITINTNAIDFTETLSLSGGGPRHVFLQPLNGLPIKQRVAEATTYKAVQSGQATGLFSYPRIPPPLFPAFEHRDQRQISMTSPETQDNLRTQFTVTWQYLFESPAPLRALPHAVL